MTQGRDHRAERGVMARVREREALEVEAITASERAPFVSTRRRRRRRLLARLRPCFLETLLGRLSLRPYRCCLPDFVRTLIWPFFLPV